MRGRVAALLVLAAAATAVLAGCSPDPSAAYFPSAAATPDSPAKVLNQASVASPAAGRPIPAGTIARPDPKLTPGAVATSDAATICHQSSHAKGIFSPRSRLISAADQQAVFSAYHISATQAKHYGLDFLVPLQLGGANSSANLWPMPLNRGLNFHQKQVLNIRVHVVVCHGEMKVDQAQRAFETDWVKLWSQYGA
jgi:hypothetical protein